MYTLYQRCQRYREYPMGSADWAEARILVFNSAKIQRSDIAVCLVDFENQSAKKSRTFPPIRVANRA